MAHKIVFCVFKNSAHYGSTLLLLCSGKCYSRMLLWFFLHSTNQVLTYRRAEQMTICSFSDSMQCIALFTLLSKYIAYWWTNEKSFKEPLTSGPHSLLKDNYLIEEACPLRKHFSFLLQMFRPVTSKGKDFQPITPCSFKSVNKLEFSRATGDHTGGRSSLFFCECNSHSTKVVVNFLTQPVHGRCRSAGLFKLVWPYLYERALGLAKKIILR